MKDKHVMNYKDVLSRPFCSVFCIEMKNTETKISIMETVIELSTIYRTATEKSFEPSS